MGSNVQDAVCAFVREIVEARTSENVGVTERPELVHRRIPAVEELLESASHRYAVEHTRLELYGGQLEGARLGQLIVPVRERLTGRFPGTYVLAVHVREAMEARIRYADAHDEIVRLTLQAAPNLHDGQTILLKSDRLPFQFHSSFAAT